MKPLRIIFAVTLVGAAVCTLAQAISGESNLTFAPATRVHVLRAHGAWDATRGLLKDVLLANDLDFFFPTRREEGNYQPTRPLEPGCGERLVAAAVKLLSELKP